ncbi:GNAT family N-acetyltransferase [Pseudalkalibacillus decolorationis]|uniref:GNAT family N-acetyltransferase n=1 Tax=Pseudalkalibacillus decolorationis TaxID=163879 RepID=UPI002148C73A|nr:GNAT family N-acetyltransferase [Pseudalkalibacillus decolorationis]
MIQFQEMNEQEFMNFRARSLKEYTQEISENYDITLERASEQASKQFNELLSDGQHTEDHFIFKLVDDQLQKSVGVIWYFFDKDEKKAFIYEIWMDPTHRGKGYGSEAIEMYHKRAKDLGARKVGLHVFGKNAGAIKLYNRLGYEATGIVMEKQL